MIGLLTIPLPDFDERLEVARRLLSELDTAAPTHDAVETFAGLSGGLTLAAMREIAQLALLRGLGADDIDDAVRAFKVGFLGESLEEAWVARADLRGEPRPTTRRCVMSTSSGRTKS